MAVKTNATAKKWHKKWSTWLAGLGAAMIAGGASIMYFGAEIIPVWVPHVVAFVAIVLVPVATSISQWPDDEQT